MIDSDLLANLPEESFLRVRIHTVRVSIEQLAADAFSKITGAPTRQTRTTTKLLCLLPDDDLEKWHETLGIIRLAQYCYRRTSDVLHGRATLVGVTPAMVDEWEEIADRLASLHRSRFGPKSRPIS